MSAPQRRAITAPASGGGGGSGASFAGGSASGSSSLASPVTRTVSLASGTSSYGRAHSRTMSALTAAEEASMAAAQELTSVANAPPSAGGGAAAWLAALPFGQAFGAEDYDAPPPPLPPGTLPEVGGGWAMRPAVHHRAGGRTGRGQMAAAPLQSACHP